MQIKLNTIMAHPRFGCFEPGAIIELVEADAKPLLEAGVADPITRRNPAGPAASLFDSAMLDETERESAMLGRPRGRKVNAGSNG